MSDLLGHKQQAREHNERMEKERFNNRNKNVTGSASGKFPPDFPDGEQIAPGVYDQGNGMIIVGDKF